MSKEVRNIFLILIGTIAIIVLSSLFIETINISLNSSRIQSDARLACKKAMSLFAQESYKSRTDTSGSASGSVNMSNIRAADGTFYITGKFYNGETVADIYKDLYGASDENTSFKKWAKELAGNWESIDLLNRYLNNISSFTVTTLPNYSTYLKAARNNFDAADARYSADLEKYTEYLVAKSYVDTYMTPLNFGVPYMDYKTVQKMFQWNLAALLAGYNGSSPAGRSAIVKDDSGKYCIEKDGFRIYAQDAKIIESSISYKVYDINKTTDRTKFENLTHLDMAKLGFTSDTGDFLYLGTSSDERQHICVITLRYEIPVSYIGITPLKSIFGFVWDRGVEGYDGTGGLSTSQSYDSSAVSNLTGGGLSGDTSGVLPVPGEIVFYLVR